MFCLAVVWLILSPLYCPSLALPPPTPPLTVTLKEEKKRYTQFTGPLSSSISALVPLDDRRYAVYFCRDEEGSGRRRDENVTTDIQVLQQKVTPTMWVVVTLLTRGLSWKIVFCLQTDSEDDRHERHKRKKKSRDSTPPPETEGIPEEHPAASDTLTPNMKWKILLIFFALMLVVTFN